MKYLILFTALGSCLLFGQTAGDIKVTRRIK